MLATQEDPHIICDAAEFANLKFTLLSLHSTIVGQPKVQSPISYFAQAGFLAVNRKLSPQKNFEYLTFYNNAMCVPVYGCAILYDG
jgi:hypothetical protein